jgi:hypothetical protein
VYIASGGCLLLQLASALGLPPQPELLLSHGPVGHRFSRLQVPGSSPDAQQEQQLGERGGQAVEPCGPTAAAAIAGSAAVEQLLPVHSVSSTQTIIVHRGPAAMDYDPAELPEGRQYIPLQTRI